MGRKGSDLSEQDRGEVCLLSYGGVGEDEETAEMIGRIKTLRI